MLFILLAASEDTTLYVARQLLLGLPCKERRKEEKGKGLEEMDAARTYFRHLRVRVRCVQ